MQRRTEEECHVTMKSKIEAVALQTKKCQRMTENPQKAARCKA